MAELAIYMVSTEASDNFYPGLFLLESCDNCGESDGWIQMLSSFECTRALGSCTIKGNLYAFLGG